MTMCIGSREASRGGVRRSPISEPASSRLSVIGFNAAYGCGQPKLTISDPAGGAHMIGFAPNSLSIFLSTPAGGTLVYRDAWTPEWTATVDGVGSSRP